MKVNMRKLASWSESIGTEWVGDSVGKLGHVMQAVEGTLNIFREYVRNYLRDLLTF